MWKSVDWQADFQKPLKSLYVGGLEDIHACPVHLNLPNEVGICLSSRAHYREKHCQVPLLRKEIMFRYTSGGTRWTRP